MKHAPATRRPGNPARACPMWIAISVEFGPGIRWVAPTRSMNWSRDSQRRRRTTSSSIMAMCAAGPPKPMTPSLRKSHASSFRRREWLMPFNLLRPFGFRVEVDDARLRLLRYVRAQIGFFGGFVTGIASLDGLLVGVAELRGVLFFDRLLDLAHQRVIDRFQDAAQIHLAGLGLSNRNDAHRPFQMRPRFIEIELRQRPILLLPGEPEIGEMITDILHRMRLVGRFAFQLFKFRPQRGKFARRVNRLCGRGTRLGLSQRLMSQRWYARTQPEA